MSPQAFEDAIESMAALASHGHAPDMAPQIKRTVRLFAAACVRQGIAQAAAVHQQSYEEDFDHVD